MGGAVWVAYSRALCLSCPKTFLTQPWQSPLRNTGHSQHSCPRFTSPSCPSSASNFSLELPLIYSRTSTSSKATARRLPGFQLSSMIMVKGMVSRARTCITAHHLGGRSVDLISYCQRFALYDGPFAWIYMEHGEYYYCTMAFLQCSFIYL